MQKELFTLHLLHAKPLINLHKTNILSWPKDNLTVYLSYANRYILYMENRDSGY